MDMKKILFDNLCLVLWDSCWGTFYFLTKIKMVALLQTLCLFDIFFYGPEMLNYEEVCADRQDCLCSIDQTREMKCASSVLYNDWCNVSYFCIEFSFKTFIWKENNIEAFIF